MPQMCKAQPRRRAVTPNKSVQSRGNPPCLAGIVMLRVSCRAFLIAAASVACASRLHSRNSVTPAMASQELTRCLSVLRAAARKGGATGVSGRRALPTYLLRPLH